MARNSKVKRKRVWEEKQAAAAAKEGKTDEASSDATTPTESSKSSKKRKRQRKNSPNNPHQKSTAFPFKGIHLAISTVKSSKSTASYQDVCGKCEALGARVSSQVSKKVWCLVASEDAISQATQRVRKAMKNHKPIVSLAWVEACKEQGRKVPFDDFSLVEQAQAAIKVYDENKKEIVGEDLLDDPNAGWSEPVSLGCCCVCHEMGTAVDCEWCQGKPCVDGTDGGGGESGGDATKSGDDAAKGDQS